MSVIFPTTPAKVSIQLLPPDASFISYRVNRGEAFILRAWMPGGIQSVMSKRSSTNINNDFYHDNCEDCHRNCFSFLDQYRDDDGELNEDDVPDDHCWVYDDGYSGQQCPEGYSLNDDSISEFEIAEMVFEVRFSYLQNDENRFSVVGTNAHLRAGKIQEESGEILSTVGLQAANVYGSDLGAHMGEVCWGANTYPQSLRECAYTYYSSEFNNDLLPIYTFSEKCEQLRVEKNIPNRYGPDEYGNQFLCQGKDAVIMVDAESNIQAFFTLLSAGFTSIPEAPHIMVIPVVETQLEKNGSIFFGFKTEPDSLGIPWFISNQGLILGQIDSSFQEVKEGVVAAS